MRQPGGAFREQHEQRRPDEGSEGVPATGGFFDLPGRESLQRVPTIDPLRGSKASVGDLIDRCDTAEELVRALTR